MQICCTVGLKLVSEPSLHIWTTFLPSTPPQHFINLFISPHVFIFHFCVFYFCSCSFPLTHPPSPQHSLILPSPCIPALYSRHLAPPPWSAPPSSPPFWCSFLCIRTKFITLCLLFCLEDGGSTYFEALPTLKQHGVLSHKTAIFSQDCENLNLIIASLQNKTH